MIPVYPIPCQDNTCPDPLVRTKDQATLLLEVMADLLQDIEFRISLQARTIEEIQDKVTQRLTSRIKKQRDLIGDVTDYLNLVVVNRVTEQKVMLDMVAPGMFDLYQAEQTVTQTASSANQWGKSVAPQTYVASFQSGTTTGQAEKRQEQYATSDHGINGGSVLGGDQGVSSGSEIVSPERTPQELALAHIEKCLPESGMVCVKLFGELCDVRVNGTTAGLQAILEQEEPIDMSVPALDDAYDDDDSEWEQ